MSEIKHTPGEWKRSHLTVTAEMNGHVIANVGEPHRMLRGADKRDMLEECKANARLIAAAPELLEALKYARRMVKASDCDIAFINAAIAKATGGPK